MQRSLLVFGGTGFLGSRICKYAADQGLSVISISPSGLPKDSKRQHDSVQYMKGDAMDHSTYSHLIPEVTSVIHSIGTLLDSRTPLNINNTYKGSYEHLNRDSALRICEALEGKDKTFVYLSAQRGLFFSPRYLSTKRDVEDYLSKNREKVPSCVVRPGFMYSNDCMLMKTVASVIDLSNMKDGILQGLGLGKLSETFVPSKSLDVDLVAKVAVLGALQPELRGATLDVADIERTAQEYHSVV